MTVTDSTLAGNTANQYGGAIDNVSTLTAVSDTIAYNVVAPGGSGGGIDAYAGTTTLYDTIVALNTVGTGTSGRQPTTSPARWRPAAPSTWSAPAAWSTASTTTSSARPIRAWPPTSTTTPGLANNGGPTQTIALVTGSPAIGSGKRHDRGRRRPLDRSTGRRAAGDRLRHRGLPGLDRRPHDDDQPRSRPPRPLTPRAVSTAAIVASPVASPTPTPAPRPRPPRPRWRPLPLDQRLTPFAGRQAPLAWSQAGEDDASRGRRPQGGPRRHARKEDRQRPDRQEVLRPSVRIGVPGGNAPPRAFPPGLVLPTELLSQTTQSTRLAPGGYEWAVILRKKMSKNFLLAPPGLGAIFFVFSK